MPLGRLLLILAAVLSLTPVLSAQSAKTTPAAKPPQLTLEIIPLKKTYFVGETVFVKYKLTSLIDGTLCFPNASAEAQQFVTGYLITDAAPTTLGGERDRFIESFWERNPIDEQLRSNVMSHWVKLGMSEPYKPRRTGKVTVLTDPGEWVLQSTYVPPELKASQKAIVESLGCTPPSVEVHSTPVTITVLSSPK